MSVDETRHFSNWWISKTAPVIFPDAPNVTSVFAMHRVESRFVGVEALVNASNNRTASTIRSPLLLLLFPINVK